MKKGFLWTVGTWFTLAGLALGQNTAISEPPGGETSPTVVQPAPAGPPAVLPADPTPPIDGGDTSYFFTSPETSSTRAWATTEYLLWWFKGAPIPPLVTSVNSADRAAAAAAGQNPGAIGSIGTQVISPNRMEFPLSSGGRLSIGMFLPNDSPVGFDVSGFLMETNVSHFNSTANVAKNPAGPLVSVPYNNPLAAPPAEDTAAFGVPGLANGLLFASSSIRMWGAEANGLFRIVDNNNFRLIALCGFRYLDLHENLNFTAIADVPAGSPALAGLNVSRNDNFGTNNQFWSGQLGLRGEVQRNIFFAILAAKVALGDMHQSETVAGTTGIHNPGVVPGIPLGFTQFPGGLFAQPTNMGTRSRDLFAVVPEVSLQVGVELTRNLRAFAGYDFLYLSNVLRPGDQIDRNINLSQQMNGTLMGTPAPAPRINGSSDFWANGLNFGLTLRF